MPIQRLFRREKPADPPARFALPDGVRVYAVGDIHGQLRLLEDLHGQIEADLAAHPATTAVEVYVGDYVDRGPDSAGVIDWLAAPAKRERVTIRGNHEAYVTGFLETGAKGDEWLANGGVSTLASYGVHANPLSLDIQATQRALREALPEHHLAFLAALKPMHRLGDLVFTHAGIKPGVALDDQNPYDLMWIRHEFLRYGGPLPVRVVHGHTPAREPEVTPYRINVDTGAFASGRLTAAVLEGDGVRFLST